MLICMLFRSYLSIIGGCFLYLFPQNGIGHTRLCNFWLQSYGLFMTFANILSKKSNFFASFLRLSCIINKKRVSLQQV